MTSPIRRPFLVLAAALALTTASAAPALANHRPGFPDGAEHAFGEMVAYPLVFPVGAGHTYGSGSDSFWATRYGNYVGPHHAQDVMAPKMTPVYAAASGVVERVNWSTNPDYLNPFSCCSMIIDHDDGWESWYIHLNNDTPGTDDGDGWGIADGVYPGARVTAGQLIGWVGDSGNAEWTAPHLHFELRDTEGIWVNAHESLVAALNGTPLTPPEERPILATSEVIRPGDTGPVVADLQALLAELGYDPGPADGIYGPRSVAATEAFQADVGLFVDGKVGSVTRAALRDAQPSTGSTGSTSDADDPTLRPGDRGDAVLHLQEDLNTAGYDPGPLDGVYGTMTVDAVEAFQRDQGLLVDGKAGTNTLARLAEVIDDTPDPADLPTLREGDRGDDVELAQTLLAAAGHSPGPADGVFGSGTGHAVVDFQRSSGLVADGVIGRQTWEALLR